MKRVLVRILMNVPVVLCVRYGLYNVSWYYKRKNNTFQNVYERLFPPKRRQIDFDVALLPPLFHSESVNTFLKYPAKMSVPVSSNNKLDPLCFKSRKHNASKSKM